MPAIVILFLVIYSISMIIRAPAQNQKAAQQRQKNRPVNFDSMAEADEAEVPQAPPPMPAPRLAAEPLRPEIQPTMHDHSDLFSGSMGDQLVEGFDFHDHGQAEVDMPSMHSADEMNASLLTEEVEEPAASFLDWSGSAVVRAVVMQEVLRRPGQRRQG